MGVYQRNVPTHYTGMARLIVRNVESQQELRLPIQPSINSVVHRLNKKPNIRPEHYAEVLATWKAAIPDNIRLAFEAFYTKKNFCIRQYFLRVVREKVIHLDDNEPALAIYEAVVRSSALGDIGVQPVATMSIHAIARWLQRSTKVCHIAFKEDLSAVMNITNPKATQVQTPDGGCWIGRYNGTTVINSDETWNPIFNVRTYYSPAMVDLANIVENESLECVGD